MEDLSNVTNRTSKGIDENVNKPEQLEQFGLRLPRPTSLSLSAPQTGIAPRRTPSPPRPT
jgi:hypothetical protein